MIRSLVSTDTDALLALADEAGLFPPDELAQVAGMLAAHFGDADTQDIWLADDDNDALVGVAYIAPERMTDRAWNLLLIAVHPERQNQGRGTTLLRHIEKTLSERGERLLLVETSGLPEFEQARAFYRKNDYVEEARIRDFYAAGDDKIVFSKPLIAV